MSELAAALECFNRKERNLLVRSALGHKAKPLQLSQIFRDGLASKLGIPVISEDAWWATDYHISWLAGALAVYFQDTAALESGRPNTKSNDRRLIEGNQEDIDLLIASGEDLIMIEAKAYGAWSNKQMTSKLARLDLLLSYYEKIKGTTKLPLRFHLVLTSLKEPQKLTVSLPAWAGPGRKLLWLPLEVVAGSVRSVMRCRENGTSAIDGDHWRVVELPPGIAEIH